MWDICYEGIQLYLNFESRAILQPFLYLVWRAIHEELAYEHSGYRN